MKTKDRTESFNFDIPEKTPKPDEILQRLIDINSASYQLQLHLDEPKEVLNRVYEIQRHLGGIIHWGLDIVEEEYMEWALKTSLQVNFTNDEDSDQVPSPDSHEDHREDFLGALGRHWETLQGFKRNNETLHYHLRMIIYWAAHITFDTMPNSSWRDIVLKIADFTGLMLSD